MSQARVASECRAESIKFHSGHDVVVKVDALKRRFIYRIQFFT